MNRIRLVLIAVCPAFCAAIAFGQQPEPSPESSPDSETDGTSDQSETEVSPPPPAMAPNGTATITRADLRRHAKFLASDQLGGRYTSTPGQIAAAEYIAKHFEELGLLPAGDRGTYFQHYPIVRSYLDPAATKLTIGQDTYKTGFAVVPGEKTKKVNLSGGFVFADHGAPSAFPKGLKRRVPVVLARPRGGSSQRGAQSAQRDRSKFRQMASAAADRGARALVICLLEHDGLGDALNSDALLPGKPILGYGKKGEEVKRPVPIPIVYTCRSLSIAILAEFGMTVDDGGDLVGEPRKSAPGKLQLRVKVDKKAKALNVVARLAGTKLEKHAVVCSAHMDHMGTRLDGDAFNGADDNASGTAGLLELAEAFALAEEKPKRSVLFLAVSGEELGLWGSEYYADHPTWPRKRIIANINIDMIGRNTSIGGGQDGVTATPSHRHKMFSTLVQDAAKFAKELGLSFANGDQYYLRSDHYNFAKHGIPVVFFCDGEHADYHKVSDHVDKLDFAKMERISRLAYWTAFAAADADKRPRTLGERPGWTKD